MLFICFGQCFHIILPTIIITTGIIISHININHQNHIKYTSVNSDLQMQAFFTGLNNGTASALISFLRTLVIQVAAVLLLPKLLGINGIWLAITVAEALTLLVTGALFLAGREKYHYA